MGDLDEVFVGYKITRKELVKDFSKWATTGLV
jgi:hypothetical protein